MMLGVYVEEVEVCIREKVRIENMDGMLNILFQIVAVGCCYVRSMKQVRFLDMFIYPERQGSKWPLVGTSA